MLQLQPASKHKHSTDSKTRPQGIPARPCGVTRINCAADACPLRVKATKVHVSTPPRDAAPRLAVEGEVVALRGLQGRIIHCLGTRLRGLVAKSNAGAVYHRQLWVEGSLCNGDLGTIARTTRRRGLGNFPKSRPCVFVPIRTKTCAS